MAYLNQEEEVGDGAVVQYSATTTTKTESKFLDIEDNNMDDTNYFNLLRRKKRNTPSTRQFLIQFYLDCSYVEENESIEEAVKFLHDIWKTTKQELESQINVGTFNLVAISYSQNCETQNFPYKTDCRLYIIDDALYEFQAGTGLGYIDAKILFTSCHAGSTLGITYKGFCGTISHAIVRKLEKNVMITTLLHEACIYFLI
jgi:hypothetical protein